MDQRMKWEEIVNQYPDEWVALAHYEEDGAVNITGTVITHNPDKRSFHQKVRELMPRYRNIAVRYTGELIKNAEIPLLWQITRTTSMEN